jgi:poly(A) polymerase
MIAERTITPQNWMLDERSVSVMRVLGGQDAPPKSLFVGGCVRNTLLGKPVCDIDIATLHRPDHVMTVLIDAGIRAIPTGLDHGTVTAVMDGMEFQITTLRRDVETDGRHAVIAFSDQWEEDAQRRDFTMNTLLASISGDIYDPTGQGLADLDARRMIFVGEPAQRIKEDYLRILRFFRFHGQYGEGRPDAAALEACSAAADKVATLSKERITQEFLKILMTPDPATLLHLMQDCGIMISLTGEAFGSPALQRLVDLQRRYEAPAVLGRLALVSGFAVDRCDEWLVLSNNQKHMIAAIGAVQAAMGYTKKAIRELVYRHGNEAVFQSYLIALSLKDRTPDLELMDIARYWHAPSFPITGKDLIKQGIPPGPELGRKLKELEEKWISSDFKNF